MPSDQTPLTYKPEDVNRDGVVNISDLVLIGNNFGDPDLNVLAQMNIYPDVNSDGVVNILDLLLTASEIDSSVATPTLNPKSVETSVLTTENLMRWIQLAKRLDTQEPRIQRGIAVLEQLGSSSILYR